jgi:hypothetical protein
MTKAQTKEEARKMLDYHNTFVTPAGQRVLKDLLNEAGFFKFKAPTDIQTAAVRNFATRILAYASMQLGAAEDAIIKAAVDANKDVLKEPGDIEKVLMRAHKKRTKQCLQNFCSTRIVAAQAQALPVRILEQTLETAGRPVEVLEMQAMVVLMEREDSRPRHS